MKKVLLVSRSLNPPWDEASKNIAYSIATRSKKCEFHVLTSENNALLSKSIKQIKVYTNKKLSVYQRLQLIRTRKPIKDADIAHFLFTPTVLNSLIFKKFVNIANVKTIQTIATPKTLHLNKRIIKKVLFADSVVTYTKHSQNILKQLGFKNTVLINPGIDTDIFKKQEPDADMRNKLGLYENDFIIVYPGEYHALGATNDLLELIPRLAREIPEIKFVFACRIKSPADKKMKKRIECLFNNTPLQKMVLHTGTFSDMQTLYNLSNIIIYPARNVYGKFVIPLVILEAMACEKPVIVSDIDELLEFTDNGNSVSCEAGNVTSLLNAIISLYKDPVRSALIGSNARKHVMNNFGIKKMVENFETLYQSLEAGSDTDKT